MTVLASLNVQAQQGLGFNNSPRFPQPEMHIWLWNLVRPDASDIIPEACQENFPGFDVARSDEEVLELIRNTLVTVWHAAGTCGMGRREDSMAVVDGTARVSRTQGLRVVNASSFALLPLGRPMSTMYALAEKIAEGILEES